MDKISIIIPIYNTAKYLHKCLQSICNQTYQNIEIICIDDGSTDGSENILDEFAKKDSRIKAVHQDNRGESAARNAGLRMITGDYVGFIDCDDWVEPNMYEILIHTIKKRNVDLVACGYCEEILDKCVPMENKFPVTREVFSRKQLFRYVFERDSYKAVTGFIWCKLFKRELLYNTGELILFEETIHLGGDLLFFIQVSSHVKKACYVEQTLYHYIQREDSGLHETCAKKRKDMLISYDRVICYMKKNNIEIEELIWVKRFCVYHAIIIARLAKEQGDREILEMCKDIMMKYRNEYIETNKRYPERLECFDVALAYDII